MNYSSFPAVRAVCLALAIGTVFFLCACAAPVARIDYTAFRESRPRSILVLPPVNRSPEIKGAASFLATSTAPLAESGYYVIPVTLADETLKQNGVTVAEEAHAINLEKLREIFGADAALYVTITRFGTSYRVINSVVEAAAFSKLVCLRTGRVLWSGNVSVVLGNNYGSGNIVVMLTSAVISQIANTLIDRSYDAARTANYQMLSAGYRDSILFGPYHPQFGTD